MFCLILPSCVWPVHLIIHDYYEYINEINDKIFSVSNHIKIQERKKLWQIHYHFYHIKLELKQSAMIWREKNVFKLIKINMHIEKKMLGGTFCRTLLSSWCLLHLKNIDFFLELKLVLNLFRNPEIIVANHKLNPKKQQEFQPLTFVSYLCDNKRFHGLNTI